MDDLLSAIRKLQDLYDDPDIVTTADQIKIPEPKEAVRDIELVNDFMKRNPRADGGRINFDSGGSPLQRLRQSLVDDLMYKFPSMKEEDMQMIVKDINLGMSTEEAQASMSSNFTKIFGGSDMFADGGRIGFNRPLSTVGKTASVVEYLKDLPKGSSFYKPDVAKLLKLGVGVKDGKEYIDTSLLTKVINSRPELKNKNFKFLTKTDVTVNKINTFIENFINENKKIPTQGEIQKGAKVDPTRLRTYITEGTVKNVADTVFDKNTKVANYILESKNPTIKGIEQIVGKGNGNKILLEFILIR